METRFSIGDRARMLFESNIPKGKVVTITGVKVEKGPITLNGEVRELVETVTCDELRGVGFSETKWYFESCFDGPWAEGEELPPIPERTYKRKSRLGEVVTIDGGRFMVTKDEPGQMDLEPYEGDK